MALTQLGAEAKDRAASPHYCSAIGLADPNPAFCLKQNLPLAIHCGEEKVSFL